MAVKAMGSDSPQWPLINMKTMRLKPYARKRSFSMMITRRQLIQIVGSVCFFVSASSNWADTVTWVNTGGGNWNDASNWSPKEVPGAADTAMITTPGSYTVTISDHSLEVGVVMISVGEGCRDLV